MDFLHQIDDRSVVARLEAVQALRRRGRGGLEVLRRRARREPNPLVLSEIVTALGELGDRESVPLLKRAAARHASQLVRTWAILALDDILGSEGRSFQRRRLSSDGSARVRATLASLLTAGGDERAVPAVRRALRSRDPIVRSRTANHLRDYPPSVGVTTILSALAEAREAEPLAALRTEIERAMEALGGSAREGAAG